MIEWKPGDKVRVPFGNQTLVGDVLHVSGDRIHVGIQDGDGPDPTYALITYRPDEIEKCE
jgi:FtsP/CotA-like multicopper oxidase with cupredoxin domain